MTEGVSLYGLGVGLQRRPHLKQSHRDISSYPNSLQTDLTTMLCISWEISQLWTGDEINTRTMASIATGDTMLTVTCCFCWCSSQLVPTFDDVAVVKWCPNVFTPSLPLQVEGKCVEEGTGAKRTIGFQPKPGDVRRSTAHQMSPRVHLGPPLDNGGCLKVPRAAVPKKTEGLLQDHDQNSGGAQSSSGSGVVLQVMNQLITELRLN